MLLLKIESFARRQGMAPPLWDWHCPNRWNAVSSLRSTPLAASSSGQRSCCKGRARRFSRRTCCGL